MYSKMTFSQQFKSLLSKRGMTQRMVAEQLDTTETTISRYASGDRTPNIEPAVELARILHVSLDTLVGVEPPAQERVSPDINILVSCYKAASVEDRGVVWSMLNRYMTPEQRIVIDSIQSSDQKTNAV